MIPYCEPIINVVNISPRGQNSNQQPQKAEDLCWGHLTLKTVLLSASIFVGCHMAFVPFPRSAAVRKPGVFHVLVKSFPLHEIFSAKTRTVPRKLGRTGTLALAASPKYQRHISKETGNDQYSEIHPFETVISSLTKN